MDNINWEEAPEGTTHACDWGKGPRWRRVTDRTVFTWHGDWKDMQYEPEVWLKEYADNIFIKPAAPQVIIINGVEVDWGKAPEGATHYYEVRGNGWWIKHLDGTQYRYVLKGGMKWSAVPSNAFDSLLENDARGTAVLISRNPEGRLVKVAKPKQQIGWWA